MNESEVIADSEEQDPVIVTDDIAALKAQIAAERAARLQAEQEADLNRQQVEALRSTKDRPAAVLDTDTFLPKDMPQAASERVRPASRPIRIAPKDALGDLRYRVIDPRNFHTPILRLHWTIPSGHAAKDRFDVYELIFKDGIAHVPAVVGEWYRANLNHRFEVENI